MFSVGGAETNLWLDSLLQLSGAGGALDQALQKLAPDMEHMERVVYPRVVELQRWQRAWDRLQGGFTESQRKRLDQHGYAFMTPQQLNLVYRSPRKYI